MINKEEVLKVAKLAKLLIDDVEIDDLILEISKLTEYVDIIKDIEADVEFDNINNISNAFNEDIVVKSLSKDEVLRNRENGENGYFLVRKNLRG